MNATGYGRLSPREREVLSLIGREMRRREIAGELRVSLKTADAHMQNVMNKLGIHTSVGLALYEQRRVMAG